MATPSNKTKLIIDVPTDLKQEFKVACVKNGLNMTDVVTSLIGSWVANLEKNKGAM